MFFIGIISEEKNEKYIKEIIVEIDGEENLSMKKI